RDVKDSDEFMVREPEQIKAYRDTWQLGIHSYLSYLRDRLLLSRDLLTDSGSIFVQIGDENVHFVRNIFDEIFGAKNFVSQISFRKKTMPLGSKTLEQMNDHIIWYAKDKESMKYRDLFKEYDVRGLQDWKWIELPNGSRREMTKDELEGHETLPKGARIYRLKHPSPIGENIKNKYPYEFQGRVYQPPLNGWGIEKPKMDNLVEAGRVQPKGNLLNYILYHDDFPITKITNPWNDTVGPQDKTYVVQTSEIPIQRCILMTTDPGDLVLDPTCGSGTTAYVAEQWGRRWITCDTSRVALTLARQRLMTTVFPYYKLSDEEMGVKGGFIYEEVPHITLKSIAQNEPPAKETLFDKSEIDRKKVRVSGPFTVEGIPQLYGQDFDNVSYEAEAEAITEQDKSPQPPFAKGGQGGITVDAVNHINTLIELLRKDGVTFPGNKRMKFENFIPVSGGFIHAEGEPIEKNGLKKIAVSFGPPHGPVTLRQVEDGIREAHINGYDGIIFCGFAFDSSAMDVKHPKVKVFYSHIRPDVLVGDLLKTTASSQLFTVFGEPDIEITPLKSPTLAKGGKGGFSGDIEYQIILKGVDIYDPLTGEVYSDNGDRIAAWFIDTDYDKRAFCISQAFFPDSSAWDRLKRALKASIDEDKFELLTSTQSLPFKLGKEKRIAVKVIDHRGNEVMVVRELK
ncbi:MAG: hypothetical protein A2Y97_10875, partial [Nitrospirae bacterium RBG_13_39_12]